MTERAGLRAGVVVTGTEVLTGRVRDANGPWLAERLLELGIDLAHVVICGDRPEDMEAQLGFLAAQDVDVVFTSGGLGPTADDLTLDVVARFAGVSLEVDSALEQRIAAIVAPMMERWPGLSREAIDEATRKQAMVPSGATVLEPVGTAPGMVVPVSDGPLVVVLPGPPGELQGMWPRVLAAEPFRALLGAAADFEESTLRLFGIPESEIAETLRVAEGSVDGLDRLEVTTCLRRGELEVVVRHDPGDAAWDGLRSLIASRHADTLFSEDGSTVDEQVAALLGERMVATAESCTGGLVAARLTDRAGSSAYVAGGVVSYSNEAKPALLGVDSALISRFGAVSVEVAEAMAAGALDRFDCFAAVSTTGVAGPDGGTEDKPVGTVCFGVALASSERETLRVHLPGSRADVRDRSTTVALHLLRRALTGDA